MHKHLEAYIARQNFTAAVFKTTVYSAANLTAQHRKELLEQIECDLSPENLCCDGELRGAALRKKAAMINGAKAELLRLQAGGTYR